MAFDLDLSGKARVDQARHHMNLGLTDYSYPISRDRGILNTPQ